MYLRAGHALAEGVGQNADVYQPGRGLIWEVQKLRITMRQNLPEYLS